MSRRPSHHAIGLGRRARGFTLIELVVVLMLVGLLVSLAAPRYFRVVDQGRVAVQRQNLAVMRDAIDKFFGDLGRYPNDLEELVQQRYLREIPLDPVSEQRDWVVVPPQDAKLGAVYDVKPARAAEEAGTPGVTPGLTPAGADAMTPPAAPAPRGAP